MVTTGVEVGGRLRHARHRRRGVKPRRRCLKSTGGSGARKARRSAGCHWPAALSETLAELAVSRCEYCGDQQRDAENSKGDSGHRILWLILPEFNGG
jgi:hypothetical protein